MTNEYVTEGIAEYVLTLFPTTFTGVCVDVGAFDPFRSSNSWLFERIGWNTYCIEPNPHCIPRLKQFRKNVLEYACGSRSKDNADLYIFNYTLAEPKATALEIFNGEAAGTGLIDHRKNTLTGDYHKNIFSETVKVNVKTLNWLMKNEIKQDHIDYLSIDVERNEMEVLKGTSLELWKPKVIVIENLDEEVEQRKYLGDRNYRYVHRISVNDIYILQEYYELL